MTPRPRPSILALVALLAAWGCSGSPVAPEPPPTTGQLDIVVWQHGKQPGNEITPGPVHIGVGRNREIAQEVEIARHFEVAYFEELPLGVYDIYMYRKTADGLRWLKETSGIRLDQATPYRFSTMFVP